MDKFFTGFKKSLIQGIFFASILIANVVTGKILELGPFIIPGAFLLYAFTFLCTDLISELYGRREANRTVFMGFILSVFAAVMIGLTKLLPAAHFAGEQSAAYDLLLGLNMRFVLASMVAYYSSQTWDIFIFHKLGHKFGGKHKWLRNNVSTMTSQVIDTAIFITIAFAGIVPAGVLGTMIVSQYILKLLIAAADTPIFYLLTRKSKNIFA